jgi:hypothetical protein
VVVECGLLSLALIPMDTNSSSFATE